MDKRFAFVFCATVAVLLAATVLDATAAELDYSYVEPRYQRVDLDNGVDGDGLGISGWFRVSERFFAASDLVLVDIDNGVDVTNFGLGVGAIQPLSANWDGIAIGMLRRVEIDTRAADRTETGYAVQAGVRGQPGPKLEARAMLNYVDIDGSDTFVMLSGDYYFTPRISAGVAASFGGDADTISIGGRFYFGAKDQ